MVKTITIRDDVYEKLCVGGKGIEVLKKIRETIVLSSEEKEAILNAIYSKRDFDDSLRY
jgi:hypothetical protein